jgi:hypothetical protein
MPWNITSSESCEADKPYAVVQTGTNELAGCHATEADARAQIIALQTAEKEAAVANEVNVETEVVYSFHAVLAVEGTPTSDGRLLEVGGAEWRNPPLPLMAQMVSTETGGHTGSVLVGRIESISVQGDKIIANGEIDTQTDAGAQVLDLLRSQTLRFVSIDMGAANIEQPDDPEAPMKFLQYEIMGATIVPFPALAGAVIWLADMNPPVEAEGVEIENPEVEVEVSVEEEPAESEAIVAAAPLFPPKSWFDDPEFTGRTAWTVLDTGQVFGHLAPWGACHTGYKNACVAPPRSKSDYAYFATGITKVLCDCTDHSIDEVRTGVVTMNGGHADAKANASSAVSHYDNTCTAVADVAVGEDEFGVWIAGALRSTVTDEEMRTLRGGGGLSGDWRPLAGNLELVAALKVNVPGFPVVASSLFHIEADGTQTSLVASFAEPEVADISTSPLEARLDALEAATKRLDSIAEPLRSLAAEQIEGNLKAPQ